ncbi:NOP56 [Mytilus edulis]|uniref:Nucleolar protein 56 n=1 Tax=Mytilus edulis TaxID=6550 RepID=A0A8S3U2S6_MYTED|nr:NOP56 [Mytilus edulis]
MAQVLFILYEHASGYALFRVKEFEEVSVLQSQVEKCVTDLSKFQSVVKLVAFSPFKSGTNALDNINSVSEGLVHEDLQIFLESNVPKASKKQKITLGVADAKIGAAITEELKIQCSQTGAAPEIIRGIRAHFHNLVKGLTDQSAGKAQLGLGHSYSRAKVKFNVNRVDNMIIQSISLLDQLDKNINTFAMRMREWYSYHFPELVKIVNDNYLYAKAAKYIGNRKEFTEEKVEELEEIVMDSGKARAIYDASRSSMGMDISPIDLINIESFASKVISLAEYRKSLAEYLRNKMKQVAPNLATLIGEQVGARLIAHAGSLTNLAKYPASTVQILGAEKALFRALKTKGNTPKYGIDCFTEFPTNVFGEHLKQQVEDRLKFYETGDAPAKNVDVMKIAVEEASEVQTKLAKKEKKKKKKEKRKSDAMNDTMETTQEMDTTQEEDEPPKKKKKKKKSQEEEAPEAETSMDVESSAKKLKKKKKKKQKDSSDSD